MKMGLPMLLSVVGQRDRTTKPTVQRNIHPPIDREPCGNAILTCAKGQDRIGHSTEGITDHYALENVKRDTLFRTMAPQKAGLGFETPANSFRNDRP